MRSTNTNKGTLYTINVKRIRKTECVCVVQIQIKVQHTCSKLNVYAHIKQITCSILNVYVKLSEYA